VATLRFANADTVSRLNWIRVQEREQEIAGKVSEIRYLCVNDMAFDLSQDGKRMDPAEHRIIVADEETKEKCRLPWMPSFGDASTVMSAVSPANGYGVLLVTMNGDPQQIGTRLRHAGWRESEASIRAHQIHSNIQGYLYEQGSAWMLVVLRKEKKQNETTALLAGHWDPHLIATQ
jgi:hypothetical protein